MAQELETQIVADNNNEDLNIQTNTSSILGISQKIHPGAVRFLQLAVSEARKLTTQHCWALICCWLLFTTNVLSIARS